MYELWCDINFDYRTEKINDETYNLVEVRYTSKTNVLMLVLL